ncbi:predicted protein [Botrytis cinerea T4]|uniref:Uncharacterized protein n=1 Tax=Botryotinia fuckeliana (strain T4) TaxID=999810 RepID=G2Y535_BOTF4|nr:predicted protein [Botrytis cinerea T4]
MRFRHKPCEKVQGCRFHIAVCTECGMYAGGLKYAR